MSSFDDYQKIIAKIRNLVKRPDDFMTEVLTDQLEELLLDMTLSAEIIGKIEVAIKILQDLPLLIEKKQVHLVEEVFSDLEIGIIPREMPWVS